LPPAHDRDDAAAGTAGARCTLGTANCGNRANGTDSTGNGAATAGASSVVFNSEANNPT
jgi:hypothetical protein